MKKILLATLFGLLFITGQSQNVQIAWGEEVKVVAETELHDDNSMSFLYTELVVENNKAASTYVQLFREQKFWEAPVYIHAEFRTFIAEQFLTNNVYMIGAAFGVIAKENGYLTLEALYRYDDRNNWQFTTVGGFFYKDLSFSHYADFYGVDRLYMFSENKLFYQLSNHFKVGCNIELGLNTREGKKWSCYPFVILRIDL
jgi:hypothetical protein